MNEQPDTGTDAQHTEAATKMREKGEKLRAALAKAFDARLATVTNPFADGATDNDPTMKAYLAMTVDVAGTASATELGAIGRTMARQLAASFVVGGGADYLTVLLAVITGQAFAGVGADWSKD